eukprot:532819_1
MLSVCTPNTESKFIYTLRLIAIITLVLCFSFVGRIGIKSIKQLQTSKNIKSIFKQLFHTSWILILCAYILILLPPILCWLNIHRKIVSIVFMLPLLFYHISLWVVLANLLLRLYFTFNDSEYAITKRAKHAFIILYSITIFLSLFALSFGAWLFFNNKNENNNIWITMIAILIFAVYGFLYIFLTILATIMFGKRLTTLTNKRATSVNSYSDNDIFDVKLNHVQM